MIDTKIACQCGNHFKFGMDLVNGRAPDGLICPTCGAPATAACNALVDFLSGKEPAPPSADTRPLKEVRVTCTCGARYKFDLELAELEMPAPVTCPSCQVDLTPIANEEIRSYPSKHPIGPAPSEVTPTPAPDSTPVTTAPPQTAAPAPANPEPSAPAPAPVAAAPSTPAQPATAASEVAVVSDPFGPPPTGKSSGPNLKPMEIPKHTRPAPGTKPAAPHAKPSTAATTATAAHPAKPGAQKPGAKPAAKSAARQPNIGLGMAGACVGAIIGAILWIVFLKSTSATPIDPKSTPMTTAWMAIVLGVLAGVGARLMGRTKASALGGGACACATLVIGIMAWQAMNSHTDRVIAPQLKSQYDSALANAMTATKATDAELKVFIARNTPSASMDGNVNVSDEALRTYRATQLPILRDFAAGKPSRESWEATKRSAMRANYSFEEAWQESIGIFGLLFLLAGILAAAKIPML